MSLEPTPVTVRRWGCPYCRKLFASKSYARNHAADCSRNPASRSCSTCRHFLRTPCCAYNSDDCGCKGQNRCQVGAFVTWRYNDHKTHTPDDNGWWKHTEDWRRDCPSWEP